MKVLTISITIIIFFMNRYVIYLKRHGLWNLEDWISILTLSITGYVTSGKLFNFSEP